MLLFLCKSVQFSGITPSLFILYYFLAHIGTGQIMGWGEKAIEVRSLETGLLDGVFTHKRAQQFRFLCERNEKVSPTFVSFL